MSKKLGIVLIATNSYFVLGIRFIKRFIHFYRGDSRVTFHFFSDTDPRPYLPDAINIKFYRSKHKNWVEGTNSKFKNILSTRNNPEDYLFYFDADTNVDKEFTEDWFIGNMVGGEHYGNKCFEKLPYERNPKSKAYIPLDTTRDQVYYYGAFFGGSRENMYSFCRQMVSNQLKDKSWGYEPGVNDESYINNYFHFNPPERIVPSDEFRFIISDKGGIGETRNMRLDITEFKRILHENKDYGFNKWEYERHFMGNFPIAIEGEIPILNEKEFSYNSYEISPEMDYELQGYFQSEKYWEHVKDEIIENFQFNFVRSPVINVPDIVSIHVRRGDYLRLSHYHTNLGVDYYKRAMKMFPGCGFFVFSDDIRWCENHIYGPGISYLDIDDPVEAMKFMSDCSHNIIANSSFSWWAAYLNKNPNKIVVAPKQWFGKDGPKNTQDLIPESWVRI